MTWQALVAELRRRRSGWPPPEPTPLGPSRSPEPPGDLAGRFLKRLGAVGGEGAQLSDVSTLAAEVERRIPPGTDIWAPGVPPEWQAHFSAYRLHGAIPPQEAFALPWGAVLADRGVAETGSLVFWRRPEMPLSLSLLPPSLLVLLPVERLLPSLEALFARAEWRERSGVLVTGPSRSADIENDLTIGVHGPGLIHVLLLPGG